MGWSLAVLDGVGQQVRHHLIQSQAIPFARDRHGVDDDCPVLYLSGEPTDDILNDRAEVQRLWFQIDATGGHARDVEQVVHQAREPGDVIDRLVDAIADPGLGKGILLTLARGALQADELQLQRIERIAQFVGGDGQELLASLTLPRPAAC